MPLVVTRAAGLAGISELGHGCPIPDENRTVCRTSAARTPAFVPYHDYWAHVEIARCHLVPLFAIPAIDGSHISIRARQPMFNGLWKKLHYYIDIVNMKIVKIVTSGRTTTKLGRSHKLDGLAL
jgi:hypothetical protein